MNQTGATFTPSLDWLRHTVDVRIDKVTLETVKVGAVPAAVHRVTLEYGQHEAGPRSVIVKTIRPNWPADPHGADRERRFYARLWPRLELQRPRVVACVVDRKTGCRVIVLEDLAGSHWFPRPQHTWTWDEIACVLAAYARLHAAGPAVLPESGRRQWLWHLALQERAWRVDEMMRLVDDLVARAIWAPLPGLARLVSRTLAEQAQRAGQPVTLLHNDVYPPNVALPREPGGTAILLDWDMLGWGMAELDLAYMFMQPFRSSEHINRADALDYYWDQRARLETWRPDPVDRLASQRHADALWALSLVPVARRVAANPYAAGTAPRVYWDAMFGVLHERLALLADGG